jgi:YVTN family beta-propeller protein
MKNYLFIFCIVLLASSCKKDPIKKDGNSAEQAAFVTGQGVFITSEGNYTFGNAKISYYNYSASSVTTDVFQTANSRPLGDICQSMSIINGKGYAVMNNSNKIEVVNMSDFKSVATITGFNSPRYMLQVTTSKAYVSDLYANAISIVNLSTNQIMGNIPLLGWTEEMALSGNKVYVTNHKTGKLYVINSITDMITDSIPLSKGANSLAFDHTNKLWVMCSGESSTSTPGGLYEINTVNDSVITSFSFPTADGPWRLTKNATGDTLYYLNHGVNKFWIGATALPSAPFITEGTRNFYGLGIDPVSHKIFVADAIDYVQSGKVYVYDQAGVEQSNFLAGIIPGDFVFY